MVFTEKPNQNNYDLTFPTTSHNKAWINELRLKHQKGGRFDKESN